MIVIADSGGTKADWHVITNRNTIQKLSTRGLHPLYFNEQEADNDLRSAFTEIDTSAVQQVNFYGAGCIPGKTSGDIEKFLTCFFKNASIIHVSSDLVGAARALFFDSPGIACILGTGANSGFYDGRSVIKHIPPLGYILGDEGSGAYIGKKLLSDFFKYKMPEGLSVKFSQKYELTEEKVIEHVYRKPFPNRYLANFCWFLFEHVNHPYAQNLAKGAIEDFLGLNVKLYPLYKKYPVSFVGSVAFYLQDVLKDVLEQENMIAGKILKAPIERLVEYHT